MYRTDLVRGVDACAQQSDTLPKLPVSVSRRIASMLVLRHENDVDDIETTLRSLGEESNQDLARCMRDACADARKRNGVADAKVSMDRLTLTMRVSVPDPIFEHLSGEYQGLRAPATGLYKYRYRHPTGLFIVDIAPRPEKHKAGRQPPHALISIASRGLRTWESRAKTASALGPLLTFTTPGGVHVSFVELANDVLYPALDVLWYRPRMRKVRLDQPNKLVLENAARNFYVGGRRTARRYVVYDPITKAMDKMRLWKPEPGMSRQELVVEAKRRKGFAGLPPHLRNQLHAQRIEARIRRVAKISVERFFQDLKNPWSESYLIAISQVEDDALRLLMSIGRHLGPLGLRRYMMESCGLKSQAVLAVMAHAAHDGREVLPNLATCFDNSRAELQVQLDQILGVVAPFGQTPVKKT